MAVLTGKGKIESESGLNTTSKKLSADHRLNQQQDSEFFSARKQAFIEVKKQSSDPTTNKIVTVQRK